ncbi:MAG: iron ABC transporter permease [Coriobacteriales bacterium]|jgi:iron complex transport system permease protein|nr:iron ABC transporter permease [Coriobacteriales bacterium]
MRRAAILVGSLVVLLLVSFLGLGFGSSSLSPVDLFQMLTGSTDNTTTQTIFVNIRLPRVLGALLAGAALAVSGCIIQAVLNNPLASPNIIGVNTGAGLAVLAVSALFPALLFLLPLAAFFGALAAALIIMGIATGGGVSRLTLVLAGIAITTIFTAGMNAVLIIYPDAYVGAGTFLVGGLSGLTLERITAPFIYILIGLVLAFISGKALNIISLGEETAQALGMNVNLRRFLLIALAALLAGAAVSFAGLLGFVGLIVPHVGRYLLGPDNRLLLPASAVIGAVFVAACDLCSRVVFAPYEMPVGICMALIGGPFFIFLIIRYRKSSYD